MGSAAAKGSVDWNPTEGSVVAGDVARRTSELSTTARRAIATLASLAQTDLCHWRGAVTHQVNSRTRATTKGQAAGSCFGIIAPSRCRLRAFAEPHRPKPGQPFRHLQDRSL